MFVFKRFEAGANLVAQGFEPGSGAMFMEGK
jgi:hypothetical protein